MPHYEALLKDPYKNYGSYNREHAREISAALSETMATVATHHPEEAKGIANILFTKRGDNPQVIGELWTDLQLYELGITSDQFKEAYKKRYGRYPFEPVATQVSGERIAREDVERIRKERAAEIKKFYEGKMEPKERKNVVEEMGTRRTIRIAYIADQWENFKSYPPIAPKEAHEKLSEALRKFDGLNLNSPGSSYVAGIEFRHDLVYIRDQLYNEIKESLNDLSGTPSLEPFVLENLFRLQKNWNTIQRMSQRDYPQSDYGFLVAAGHHMTRTYRSKPDSFYSSIEPAVSKENK